MSDLKKRAFSSIFLLAYLWLFLRVDSLFWTCILFTPIVIATFYEVNERVSVNRVNLMAVINIYLLFSLFSIIFIKNVYGAKVLFVLLTISISADSFAYMFGKIFKGKKLCPSISPSKTISGLIGGVTMAWIIGYFAYTDLVQPDIFNHKLIAITLFVAAAVVGDLIESAMKRSLDIKDFGVIIPGHGGLFDRLDSIMCIVTIFVIALAFKL